MSTSGLLLLRRVQAHRNTTKATEAVPVLYRGAPPDGTYPSLRRLSRTSPGIPSSRPAAAGVPTRQGVPPRGPPPGSGRPGPPRKPRFRNRLKQGNAEPKSGKPFRPAFRNGAPPPFPLSLPPDRTPVGALDDAARGQPRP